ncbi:MAG: hypothetical protein K2J00_03585, partial [Bacteroidaceae bacterium]|nr:hypothetical protein [Bacteroidaceae bacterium]
MRKFTSFFAMMVLCCISALAQETVGTTLPENVFVKIGTVQSEMVPGKWYFLHNPRKPGNVPANLEDFRLPGDGDIADAGGLVTDNGAGAVMMSVTSVIGELTNEDGVNIDNYLKHMVRFVEVPDVDGAYNIQFGTKNWVSAECNGNTALKTCSNTMYLAGEAGQYNFYLIPMTDEDDRPNTAGRFGWNRYNMLNRVDNNAAGSTVAFWDTGKTTSGNLNKTTDEEVFGNKVWQIYDIEIVGEITDEIQYRETFNKLVDKYAEIAGIDEGSYVTNLMDGVNVGSSYGNYRQEDVDAFLAFHANVEEVIVNAEDNGIEALRGEYPEVADLQKLYDDYVAVYNSVEENRISRSMPNIAPGYYTIINAALNFWYETVNDTTFYTQEEADLYNAEQGLVPEDEDYKTTESIKEVISHQEYISQVKALCSQDSNGQGWLAWRNLEEKPNYLWKIESVEGKPLEYRLINMLRGTTFKSIGTSANAKLVEDADATVCIDYRDHGKAFNGKDTIETDIINIRSSSQAEDNYYYLHCGSHSSGAGKGAWIVGWSGSPDASRWFLQPVDEATANEWLNGPAAQLRAMIHKADSIANAGPAQINIAKDIKTTIFEEDSVVVTASQFYSQYTTEDQQNIPDGQTVYDFLIDGKQSTYWHSRWEDGNQPFSKHYLQIEANETLEGLYAVKLTRRPVNNDAINQLAVKGYEEAPTDETTFEDGKDLGVLTLPFGNNSETVLSNVFDATGCNYLRFYSLATVPGVSGGQGGRGYWHASEFNVFKAEQNKRYETTQYDVRKAQADALTAAIENWLAGEYDEDDISLLDNEEFMAAYNAIINAGEAWGNVYVDPTALREAIENAPAEDLFVKGNNPGQWSEGAETPAAKVEAAEAYNASGAYSEEQSEAHIKAIQDATDNVFASANKVQTNKWYRFSFPTEETYEKYEWAKTGAQATINATTDATVSPALFGKTVAA